MEIGNKIKGLRLHRGVTQETLAEALGVTAQAVSKWERDAGTPDIALLPALAAYFGVSIDELFALSDDTRMERIQNMLWDQRVLDPALVEREREFLLEKGRREPENSRVYVLLADMEYQLGEEHWRRAADYAMEGIRRQPEDDSAHSAYVQASRGAWGMRYSADHHELIDFYKDFVAQHPGWMAGYLWLIDQLLADCRLTEAEEYCERLARLPDVGYRAAGYQGEIAWLSGRREEALDIWNEMVRSWPDKQATRMRMGDCLTRAGRYEEAKECYRRSMEVQQKPRYTDGLTSIAHICEIQKDWAGAIAAHEEEMEVLRTDWDATEGEQVDQHRRKIAELKKKL